MANHKSIGVIGLGKFGLSFCRFLVELGQEVVGLDRYTDNVRRAQGVVTQVYEGDATDRKVLEQLGFADLTHVMISVGSSIEASAMISLYLKELGTRNVWVKAISADHERLLRRIGVDEVVFPEEFAARELAHRLAIPGLVAYLPFARDVAIKELPIDRWAGKSLADLDLTNRFRVQVIAVKDAGSEDYRFVPKPREKLSQGDVLVVMGRDEDLDEVEKS